MSGAKHTPGPLTVNERGVVCHAAPHGYQEPVKLAGAWVEDAWIDDEEARANATLYASAPDLLEALTLILPLAKGYRPEGQTDTARRTCNSWVEAAEEAIAKATGADK